MKGSMRAATAIGVGYLLGRRKKLRTAALIAAGTAVSGAAAGGAVRQGIKKAGSADALGKVSPQLGEVTKAIRGELVTAGKAAATAAVNNRVDALAGSLHQRAERLRGAPGGTRDEPRDADEDRYEDDEYDEPEDEEPDEEEELDEFDDEGPDDEGPDDEGPDDEYEDDDELTGEEDEDEDEDEAEPDEDEEDEAEPERRPAPRRRTAARGQARKPPVTRTRK